MDKPRSSPGFSFLVTCEGSVSHIHCEKGVIFMISATYGRSDRMTCSDGIPDDQTKNTDCAMNVESVYDRCNGKSECSVLASSSVFGDPCVGTYKYLEVLYFCLRMLSPQGQTLVVVVRKGSHPGEPKDVASLPEEKSLVACEGAVARLHCARGQVIYVTSASYGRTNKKTCSAGRPADQLENTECYTYREEVGERCNGKQWCKVRASNYVFGNPCYGTYKYLEVEYICYEVPQSCPE
ncbi:PREDICTED: L-rhamnose-binding lectin CSL3-like [Poecilia mexicana]|uniref:L-rhamnose-binding lectin CSL3-like n=1 Tax=Poecilia mexicana TaxID=48701 RepID=UPI00072EE650|nr:PREDICTED: L-rhamnose-binding lectin CSL3-like [Poecilia mexicana]